MRETVLFLEWKSFGNDFLLRELRDNGYEIEMFPFPRETEDVRNGAGLTEKLAERILAIRPQFVFSFNYFPVAAIACKACRTKYVTWVYDSPYILLYSQTIFYDTNRVFLFDSYEAEKLKGMGAKNVFYLPMAAAVDYYDSLTVTAQDHREYDSDITFIGSTYSEEKQHMFRHLKQLDSYTKGYLDGIMLLQKNLYGMDILEGALTDEILNNMKKVCPIHAHGDGLETEAWVFANYFLARKVTAMERQEILSLLSQTYEVTLFTPEDTPQLPKVHNRGKLDYYTQAPLAMKCAKINLNISLRSIHSGMPLRALDILGCGGFLLTNYQADYAKYLEAGRDYVYYEDVKQIPELVSYYLQHEDERKEIAKNGYHKVKEYLNYSLLVKKILNRI